MVDVNVLDLLTRHLGQGDIKKGSNYAFYCPFCNHYKKKFEIDIDITPANRGRWHCWVCNARGKSVRSLLKKLNAPSADFTTISDIKPVYTIEDIFQKQASSAPPQLPDYFQPLKFPAIRSQFPETVAHLTMRGLTVDDIIKYKIGVITYGRRAGCAVFPSFNSDGHLNYYVLKNFQTGEYINPSISRDVVIFDMFINWKEPIVIVEGVFDAIAVQRNVTPLLGKALTKALKAKIVSSELDKVYIALDGGEHAAINSIAEYVQSIGKRAYKVTLPENEDPSSIGKAEIWTYIDLAEEMDSTSILMQNIISKW